MAFAAFYVNLHYKINCSCNVVEQLLKLNSNPEVCTIVSISSRNANRKYEGSRP